MSRHRLLAHALVGLSIWGSLILGVGGSVAAQGTLEKAMTLPLVPAEAPGFVEIKAVTVQADLTCREAQCSLEVNQHYQLHNRDRLQTASLAVTLAPADTGAIVEHRLLAAEGAPIPAVTGTPAQMWRLSLAPDEQRTIQIASRHDLGGKAFIPWEWDMAALAAWGQIVSARIVLRLPQHMTDDALLTLLPPATAFDGREIVWEYEALAKPSSLTVTLISPAHWQRLREQTLSADRFALAQHRLELYRAAQQQGLTYPDPFDLVIADLLAVAADDPRGAKAHATLAELYIERAEAHSDLRLNYWVLAARELEALLARSPDDGTIAEQLGHIYYEAAQAANEQGDPAGALAYLHKAAAISAPNDATKREAIEELTLRWAVDLAAGGQVPRAIQELQGVMSPQIRYELFRYAPPLVSLRTSVELSQQERLVLYHLSLYQPTHEATLTRLQELVNRLGEISGCEARLGNVQALAVDMRVRVTYASPEDLGRISAAIAQALADQESLAALLSVPWQYDVASYRSQRSLLWTEWTYAEKVDTSSLATLQTEAQYAHWRLVELRNVRPVDSKSVYENQIALLALREQVQIWDRLPSASYWIYRVQPPADVSRDASAWLVPWGEARSLTRRQRVIHWTRIARGGIVLFLAVAGLAILRRFRHR